MSCIHFSTEICSLSGWKYFSSAPYRASEIISPGIVFKIYSQPLQNCVVNKQKQVLVSPFNGARIEDQGKDRHPAYHVEFMMLTDVFQIPEFHSQFQRFKY
jgi:hypothetical protein